MSSRSDVLFPDKPKGTAPPTPEPLLVDAVRERRVGKSVGRWHVHSAAVSNFTGTAPFTKNCTNELCNLGDSDDGGWPDERRDRL